MFEFFLKFWLLLVQLPSTIALSKSSGFASLAPKEEYLRQCSLGNLDWFQKNYPNMIEPFVVNKLTANGESCAHLLAKSGSKDTMEVTRYFLKSGGRANSVTNVPNGANPTALAINVMRNNYDVVELMLEGSVKTDVKFRNENNNEVTVMDLAFQRAAGKPKESPEYMMLALLDQYDAVAMSGQKFVRPVVAVPLPVPVPVQVPVPEPVVLVAEPLVDEVEKTVDEKIEL